MPSLTIVAGPQWDVARVELDLTVLVQGDDTLSFDELAPGGILVGLNSSPPANFVKKRLMALMEGVTQAPAVFIYGVPSDFSIDGHVICEVGGLTWEVGFMPGAIDINVAYDTGDCSGNGSYAQGLAGRIDAPTFTVLFHELTHAYHIMEADEPFNELLAEKQADEDENLMRIFLGLPQRNATNHQGGCKKPCSKPKPGGQGLGKFCFIVSAASGSPRSPEVEAFRRLRDDSLRCTHLGQVLFEAFFREYYQFSPRIAAEIEGSPEFKRAVLDFFVEPLLGFFAIFREVAGGPVGAAASARGHLAEAGRSRGLSAPGVAAIAGRLAHEADPGAAAADPGVVGADPDFERALGRILAAASERSAGLAVTRWSLLAPLAMFWDWAASQSLDSAPPDFERCILAWLGRLPVVAVDAYRSPGVLSGDLALLPGAGVRNPRVATRIAERVVAAFDLPEDIRAAAAAEFSFAAGPGELE